MRQGRRTTIRPGLAIAAAALAFLALTRPWTVRPLNGTSAAAFAPDTYVDSIWAARVLPTARASAVDVSVFAAEVGGASGAVDRPKSVFVKGTGEVIAVDLKSRTGVARMAFGPPGARIEAAVQIGPVVRGTAIRDALTFIRFSDFTNQIDFAGVASALNARVVTSVLAGIDPATLEGRTVSVTGAVPLRDSATGATGPLDLVPVIFEIQR